MKVLRPKGSAAVNAVLEDSSSHGVRLKSPSRVPVNTPVEIETRDVLILGDVCRCTFQDEKSFDPCYHVAVKVVYRLMLGHDLYHLSRALAGQPQHAPALTWV